jgi:hypothetical protein
MTNQEAYHLAQRGLADLKSAAHAVLVEAPLGGLTHVQVGRLLGVYGSNRGTEGFLPRAVLALLEQEGLAELDADTMCWRLADPAASD